MIFVGYQFRDLSLRVSGSGTREWQLCGEQLWWATGHSWPISDDRAGMPAVHPERSLGLPNSGRWGGENRTSHRDVCLRLAPQGILGPA
jgi:hypothetical protein